jgi:hypothetical protein
MGVLNIASLGKISGSNGTTLNMAVFWEAMKYSRLISHVNIELETNVLEPIINPVDGGRASIRNAGFNSSLTELIAQKKLLHSMKCLTTD